MQLFHLTGDAHTQPATRKVKQKFFSPKAPLGLIDTANYQRSELST